MSSLIKKAFILITLGTVNFSVHASLLMKPTLDLDLVYNGKILDGKYQSGVSNPELILGFEIGARVATPAQITKAVEIWADQSDRMKVVEYARSHEGRPLHAVFISSADNLSKLNEIKTKVVSLSDARSLGDDKASEIIDDLPAIAWMAYSIHGNETSGADAALASIYHLIASIEKDVESMLDLSLIHI